MLKNLLDLSGIHQFKDLTEEKCRKVLVQAICNILSNCKESSVFRCVTLARPNDVEKAQEAADMEEEEEVTQDEGHQEERMETSLVNEVRGSIEDAISIDEFHERLVITNYETIEEVEKFFVDNYEVLSNRCGVLLFLYSVLFTKGIEALLSEIGDTSEPLIHQNFGYGSQSLINLFLTGRAVAHVFDNDQDIGGMKLKGIDRQSDIGFMTLMEQMRYCTVGSFFKNPKYPIWIVASETHLTVLFSNEKSLVSPETPAENARRIFAQYDTENTGFISSAVLQDVMSALGLESDPDYVEIMRKKLDADSTSIILLTDFMYEFFPDDKKSTPDTFTLFHYNGILSSNDNHKVRYSQGNAILLESHTTEMYSLSNQMLTVLQTKWPNIEVNWLQDRVPSLN
jgi:ubiquitin carboxyl-terminal hydrolase MINDY-3/4